VLEAEAERAVMEGLMARWDRRSPSSRSPTLLRTLGRASRSSCASTGIASFAASGEAGSAAPSGAEVAARGGSWRGTEAECDGSIEEEEGEEEDASMPSDERTETLSENEHGHREGHAKLVLLGN